MFFLSTHQVLIYSELIYSMKVPYLDLRVSDKIHKAALLSRLDKVLSHGRIIEGPEVDQFEQQMAQRVGVKYAVGVSSGSSALYIALKSLGIGEGDEVITTPFTWIITVNAIAETGAKPVFADVGIDCNINPEAVRKKISRKTKAIVPMHVGGHLCDMSAFSGIARKYGLHIVEDAAQAICGRLALRPAGSFSTVAAFSMNPMKVLHGYGEAGVVTTNNRKIYQRLKKLRHAGTRRDPLGRHINQCDFASLNHKIDTVQAAFLLENLKRLDDLWRKREQLAKVYDEKLNDIVRRQDLHPEETHGRYLYLIQSKKRNGLRRHLNNVGIETKIVYSPLASDAKPYRDVARSPLPISRQLQKETLSLPLHEKMTVRQAKFVADEIKGYLESS